MKEWVALFPSLSSGNNGNEVELKSALGMDYSKLRDLLKAGRWKEADQETAQVMIAVMKQEEQGWLNTEHIYNFPCEDLSTIDQLWVKYSDGRFGFSVQKRIYKGLDVRINYDEKIWQSFGDKVGWRQKGVWVYYKDITFDKKAPEGHLPFRFMVYIIRVWFGAWFEVLGGNNGGIYYSSLLSRLVKCNI